MRSFRYALFLAASTTALLIAHGAVAHAQSASAPSEIPSEPSAVGSNLSADPAADDWVASDLPADPGVRFGVLPNGMKYALLQNATPPGQASFRLRIDAGSLMERDDQLGLAHFMEHMAFNGTTNIPENELLRLLERHGLAFGADTNAFTNYDQTVYQLDLPRTDAAIVDDALRVMREQVSEALMASDAIDSERGVIEGEERQRNSPYARAAKAGMTQMAPHQLISRRLPIGDLSIIRSAPRERFVEFYDAYYRPSRATFIAVGDFDLDAMEAKVRGTFENWRARGPDGPEPDLGVVADRETEVKVVAEAGAPSFIQMSWIQSPDRTPDSIEKRRRRLIRGLGFSVLNRRLAERARAAEPAFSSAEGGGSTVYGSFEMSTVSATFEPGRWRPALEALEQEQRRLVQFGVSDDEVQREVVQIRAYMESAAASAGTRDTPSLAGALLASANDATVFTTPQTDLDLYNGAVRGLSGREVSEALRAALGRGGPLVLLVTPVPIDGGEATVEAALTASQEAPVSEPLVQAVQTWPYVDFGPAGEVVRRTETPEIGVTTVDFANGVRLVVKPTTFVDDEIKVDVRVGLGVRGLPSDEPLPISWVGPNILYDAGLGRLTGDQASRALVGKRFEAAYAVEGDAFTLSGLTRPDDLDTQLQVMAALMSDLGNETAAFVRLQASYPGSVDTLLATPGGAFGVLASGLMASGDVRVGYPSKAQVAAWTSEQLNDELRSSLTEGRVDVIMVGDVALDRAIEAVARSLGALPANAPATPAPTAADIRFPQPTAIPVRLKHNGPRDQALGFIAWPIIDQVDDRTEARGITVMSAIFNLRVTEEIRERRGLAYSPNVEASPSPTFKGMGSLSITAETSPDKLDEFFAAVEEIAATLRDAPPSQDELDRARLPMLESVRRRQAGNSYWMAELAPFARRPEMLEQMQTRVSDLESLTPADIQALARRYLRPDRAWRATVTADTASATRDLTTGE